MIWIREGKGYIAVPACGGSLAEAEVCSKVCLALTEVRKGNETMQNGPPLIRK